MIEPTFQAGAHGGTEVTRQQARKTACLVAFVLALVAGWQSYRGRATAAAVLGAVALALPLVGLSMPGAARRFHLFWMRAAAVLGHWNSRVLLTLMYYLVLTPYGLLSRLFGRDPLARRGAPGESYWVERKRTRQEKEQFERLF